MKIAPLKKEIIEYGRLCGEKNFTPGVSGNISARYEDKILITSSGSANGYLTEDEFSLIDFEGNVLEGNPKASSEKMVHIEFYKKRKDINYVIHVHPPYLCTFASCGKPMDEPLMAEIVYYYGQIPLAEYGLPSSKDLVEKTAKYFDKYDSVLMANHGFITGGSTIKEAYLKLEMAEGYAQVLFNTKLLENEVLLTDTQVQEILKLKS